MTTNEPTKHSTLYAAQDYLMQHGYRLADDYRWHHPNGGTARITARYADNRLPRSSISHYETSEDPTDNERLQRLARDYEPYDTISDFWQGVNHYLEDTPYKNFENPGYKAQAYDRGRECAMRWRRGDQPTKDRRK
jgi:hypothetical protein